MEEVNRNKEKHIEIQDRKWCVAQLARSKTHKWKMIVNEIKQTVKQIKSEAHVNWIKKHLTFFKRKMRVFC